MQRCFEPISRPIIVQCVYERKLLDYLVQLVNKQIKWSYLPSSFCMRLYLRDIHSPEDTAFSQSQSCGDSLGISCIIIYPEFIIIIHDCGFQSVALPPTTKIWLHTKNCCSNVQYIWPGGCVWALKAFHEHTHTCIHSPSVCFY